jgi:hypothetical protein
MAVQAAIGVQQEALVSMRPAAAVAALAALEARPAQPLQAIQTSHTWQQEQD